VMNLRLRIEPQLAGMIGETAVEGGHGVAGSVVSVVSPIEVTGALVRYVAFYRKLVVTKTIASHKTARTSRCEREECA